MAHDKPHFDEIEIIGIRNSDPLSFKVVFEVDGENFNQDFPKRLSHSFRKEERVFKEWDDGEFEFEKKLRDTYVGAEKRSDRPGQKTRKDEIKAAVEDVNTELDNAKKSVKGRVLSKDGNFK